MSDNNYDEISKILKESRKRYPDDAFTNTRRLKGLLTDHLAGLDNEINIVLGAIDEGIPDELAKVKSGGLDIAIDRLSDNLETARGIRPDIAKSAVMACAYSMGLSDLPSSQIAKLLTSVPLETSKPMPEPVGAATEDWVGVSEAISSTNTNANTVQNTPQAPPMTKGILSKFAIGQHNNKAILLACAALVVGYVVLSENGGSSPPPPQQPDVTQPRQTDVAPPRQPDVAQPRQPDVAPPRQPDVAPPRQPDAKPPPPPPPNTNTGNTAQLWFATDDGTIWRINPASNMQAGPIIFDQSNGELRAIIYPKNQNTYSLELRNGSNKLLGKGEAKQTDKTHFSYSLNGESGKWHIGHKPK